MGFVTFFALTSLCFSQQHDSSSSAVCSPLKLCFAGDVMAHTPNFKGGKFNQIWEDVKPVFSASDFTFANLEAPVNTQKPFDTYPTFNMEPSYPQAAIDAGINVFSLANNHTNDQGLEGILSTYRYFEKLQEQSSNSERKIYACGIKNKKDSPITYKVIQKGEWKILFAAVTEILNQKTASGYIDFYKPKKEIRQNLADTLKKLRQENECDLFVLSIHCTEPEYITTVSRKQRNFYMELLNNGVDIVWANHPHVVRKWELVNVKKDKRMPADEENLKCQKLIFYSMGNTISGQRTKPDFANPSADRDNTGDGLIINVDFEKIGDKIKITKIDPHLITTIITASYGFQVKLLTDDYINQLYGPDRKGSGETKYLKSYNKKWAAYLTERKKIMEEFKGQISWQ